MAGRQAIQRLAFWAAGQIRGLGSVRDPHIDRTHGERPTH